MYFIQLFSQNNGNLFFDDTFLLQDYLKKYAVSKIYLYPQ